MLENAPHVADDLNAVLAHGRLHLVLDDGQPGKGIELDDPASGPAWASARTYLVLAATAPPGRIRRCAGTGCVLWFLDTSRNEARRWCSMADAFNHRGRT